MQANCTPWLRRGKEFLLQPPGLPEVPGLSASLPGRPVQLPWPRDSCLHRGWKNVPLTSWKSATEIQLQMGRRGPREALASWGLRGVIRRQEHLFHQLCSRGVWTTSVCGCEEGWLPRGALDGSKWPQRTEHEMPLLCLYWVVGLFVRNNNGQGTLEGDLLLLVMSVWSTLGVKLPLISMPLISFLR